MLQAFLTRQKESKKIINKHRSVPSHINNFLSHGTEMEPSLLHLIFNMQLLHFVVGGLFYLIIDN